MKSKTTFQCHPRTRTGLFSRLCCGLARMEHRLILFSLLDLELSACDVMFVRFKDGSLPWHKLKQGEQASNLKFNPIIIAIALENEVCMGSCFCSGLYRSVTLAHRQKWYEYHSYLHLLHPSSTSFHILVFRKSTSRQYHVCAFLRRKTPLSMCLGMGETSKTRISTVKRL